jgi:hypothetical protein
MFVAMGVAVAVTAVALLVTRSQPWSGIAAVALVLFASTYGVNASLGTYNVSASDSATGSLYALGQDLIAHLRAAGFAVDLPRFWYDGGNGVHGAVQSLYYYGYSYLGTEMPTIDADFRARMEQFKPQRIVLLCESAACNGASRALAHSGYEPRLQSRVRLTERSLAMWVEIYGVTTPASG